MKLRRVIESSLTHLLIVILLITQQIIECAKTTSNIGPIIVGRCLEASNFEVEQCNELYSLFHSSISNKNNLDITLNDYYSFFENLPPQVFTVPRNNTLFWSNSNKIAHTLSNSYPNNFVTLEDTILGRSFNNLQWCPCLNGSEGCSSDGLSYSNDCEYGTYRNSTDIHGAMVTFWSLASTYYARNAQGDVTVLVSAQRSSAYRKLSFFSVFEIPNLNSRQITSVRILLIKNETTHETCKSGSVLTLFDDLKSKFSSDLGGNNLPTINCIDDYPTVRHIVCSNSPQSKECAFIQSFSPSRVKTGLLSTGSFILGVGVGILSVLITISIRFYYKKMKGKLSTVEDGDEEVLISAYANNVHLPNRS
jgi:hypothetical protein